MSSSSLQGSLDSFKLPDVLAFLNSAKKTGMLTLTADEREAYVFFRSGVVVYAASNQTSFRLGAILLHKKVLTREQCDAIEIRLEAGRPTQAGQVIDNDVQCFQVSIKVRLNNKAAPRGGPGANRPTGPETSWGV